MSLYGDWQSLAGVERMPEESKAFWDEYFALEKKTYEKILDSHQKVFEGNLIDLAAEFEMEPVVFTGFIDGVNTSLKNEHDLNKLKENTPVRLDVDFEKLYFNMLEAKAKWLYTLPQWDHVLSQEIRKRIAREWRASKQAASEKIGRNTSCPCGSGKKYKKCCGKNA